MVRYHGVTHPGLGHSGLCDLLLDAPDDANVCLAKPDGTVLERWNYTITGLSWTQVRGDGTPVGRAPMGPGALGARLLSKAIGQVGLVIDWDANCSRFLRAITWLGSAPEGSVIVLHGAEGSCGSWRRSNAAWVGEHAVYTAAEMAGHLVEWQWADNGFDFKAGRPVPKVRVPVTRPRLIWRRDQPVGEA